MEETNFYHHSNVDNYLQVVLDTKRKQIILGAKNSLLRLDILNLKLFQYEKWEASKKNKIICHKKGRPSEECENYIKLLAIDGEFLLACGTQASSPVCQWRKADSLDKVIKTETGIGKIPHFHLSNTSFLFTSSGDLYAGLHLDAGGWDWAVVRSLGFSPKLRTPTSNSLALDHPSFVSMFEDDRFVYIFFREIALEWLDYGKVIISRIARVCKYDHGGFWNQKGLWRSFVKATLNCSRPGEYPFPYNEIQSVFFDENKQIFTSIFTTSPNSMYGSAVCRYSLEDINNSFEGMYNEFDRERGRWRVTERDETEECPKPSEMLGLKISPKRVMTNSHFLAEKVVQPLDSHPLIEHPGERYNHIATETIKRNFRGQRSSLILLYLTSIEGFLRKVVVLPSSGSGQNSQRTSCLIESIQIAPPDLPQAPNFLIFNPLADKLLIGTNSRVYQLEKHRCHRFQTREFCEAAQDPHCLWQKNKCQFSEEAIISGCPNSQILREPLVIWSDWSGCSVTCGMGVRMKVKVCLDEVAKQLEGPEGCQGSNFVTMPCKMDPCHNKTNTQWSPWMTVVEENGLLEQKKKFRCVCEERRRGHGCKPVLKSSDKKCQSRRGCHDNTKKVGRGVQSSSDDQKNVKNLIKEEIKSEEFKINKQTKKTKKRINFKNKKRNHKNSILNTKVINPSESMDSPRQNPLVTLFFTHTTTKPSFLQPMTNPQSTRRAYKLINRTPLNISKPKISIINHYKPRPLLPVSTPCPLVCPPVPSNVFHGYCGCRDMGVFRICHKC